MRSEDEERRKNSRNKLKQDSELDLPGRAVYRGATKNISFSGVYMYCQSPESISVGETGLFRINIRSGQETDSIIFKCLVIRTDHEGVGLQFTDIDLEGYQKFRRLMLYNSSDPDRLLAELDRSPGLEIRSN